MKDTAHLKGFGRVATHLIGLGVKDSDAFRFQHHVDRLITTRGTKGALSWLDSLGNLVSERVFKIRLPSETWVSRKYYRIFKKTKNRELLRRLTKIKRCVVERQITAQQAKKFLEAALRQPVDPDAWDEAASYIRLGIGTLRSYIPKNHDWKASSCLPDYVRRELVRGHDEDEANARATVKLRRDCSVAFALELHQFKPVVEAFHPLSSYELFSLADSYEVDENDLTVGTINCTQEPGGKLRVFAAPLLALQSATEPLQVFLMSLLRQLPEDSCFCEKPAIYAAQDTMRAGRPVIIRDLRNATDNAPASLAWLAMSLIPEIPREHIQLLVQISESAFRMSDEMLASGYFPKKLKWSVGQPLGTKPSFGAFSLFHHALMRGIAVSLGKPMNVYYFKGDDYECFDEECDAVYCRIMGRLGVPIPPEKSSVSHRYAEFAGQTILREEAFYPGKWREVTEDSLWGFILDPCFDIDRVVPRLWGRLIRRIQETPYPYGLLRPTLEDMDSHSLSEFSRAIEELFLVQTLTSSRTDTLRPEWLTNRKLVSNMFYTQDWPTLLYPDLDASHPLCARQRTDRKTFASLNIWHQPEDTYPGIRVHSGSLLSLFWEESSAYQSLMTGFKYHVITRRQLMRLSQVAMSLRDHEQADLRCSLNLIRSIILSVQTRLTVWDWVEGTPLLKKVYGNTLSTPDHLDLVHAVVTHFPHFEATDFNQIGTRFVSVLRKFSRPSEVMPQRTTPLPRLRRG